MNVKNERVAGKPELVERLSAKADITKVLSRHVLDAIFEVFADMLQEGIAIRWFGFGTLVPYTTAQRMGRNPKTGEEFPIPPRRKVRFRESPDLMQETANFSTYDYSDEE